MLGRIVIGALILLGTAGSTVAATTDDFYKGKTVKILVGASAGGAFDTCVGRDTPHLPFAYNAAISPVPDLPQATI